MEPAFANIGNYRATEDWWFLLPAILLVDLIVMFLVRFLPETFGKPVNVWYDQFGLAAVMSDVGIIAIGLAIARYAYSNLFMAQEGWSIWYFIALAVFIQLVHDVAFKYLVIDKIPAGHNDMIDVFKAYVVGGAKILAADAAMVVGSIGIGAFLKAHDFHYTVSTFLVSAYALSYILFTNVKFPAPPATISPQQQRQNPQGFQGVNNPQYM
jgi:hypothetical protein